MAKRRSIWVVEVRWKKQYRGHFATDKWMLDLSFPQAHETKKQALAYFNQIPLTEEFNYRAVRYDASK